MNATFEILRDYHKSIFCVETEYSFCDPHFHSSIEIVYVAEGEIVSTINGITEKISAGGITVASSYDIHSYSTPDYSKCRVLIIPVDIVGSFKTLSQSKTFNYPFLQAGDYSRDIDYTLKKLLKFHDTRDSMIAKGYIYVILGILTEKIGLCDRGVSDSSEALMQNILLYLEKRYLEKLTLSDLAHNFGYNKEYLSRLFTSKLGCGFNQYLNVLRSRHAANLIHNSKMNLTEIAYASGFGCARSFNRAFQSFYNLTPQEYKKRIAKNN